MFTWQIVIKKSATAPGFAYDPNPLTKVEVGDEIIWVNDDDKPHWPGAPGKPAAYMANQIAANSSSTTYVPTAAATLKYADSLTPADHGGTIQVTS